MSSSEIYTLKAYSSALNPAMVRRMMDKFGDAVRLRGNKAQAAAYDYLMLYFDERKFPAEVNLEIASKFGLYPSRFDLDESLNADVIWVMADGELVARIEELAIPALYANFCPV